MHNYQIKTEQFEGPMDLLLQMTEDQKLDITRVSLAKIADQYLEYIANTQNITLEHLADFLSVASRLILIKSKTWNISLRSIKNSKMLQKIWLICMTRRP